MIPIGTSSVPVCYFITCGPVSLKNLSYNCLLITECLLLTASMARKIYLRGGIGVGGFRRMYGGSKRNGSRPPHFCKSSGAIARHILQQLQAMNIVDLDSKGGRRITSSGQRDLDQVAGRIVVAP